MKKTYFELRLNMAEIHGSVTESIYHGCVNDELLRNCTDCGGTVIDRFENKNDALAALSRRETSICTFGYNFFRVEEFIVEENAYMVDEDGDEEWIAGGDVWGYSAMPGTLLHSQISYRWSEEFNRYIEEEDET